MVTQPQPDGSWVVLAASQKPIKVLPPVLTKAWAELQTALKAVTQLQLVHSELAPYKEASYGFKKFSYKAIVAVPDESTVKLDKTLSREMQDKISAVGDSLVNGLTKRGLTSVEKQEILDNPRLVTFGLRTTLPALGNDLRPIITFHIPLRDGSTEIQLSITGFLGKRDKTTEGQLKDAFDVALHTAVPVNPQHKTPEERGEAPAKTTDDARNDQRDQLDSPEPPQDGEGDTLDDGAAVEEPEEAERKIDLRTALPELTGMAKHLAELLFDALCMYQPFDVKLGAAQHADPVVTPRTIDLMAYAWVSYESPIEYVVGKDGLPGFLTRRALKKVAKGIAKTLGIALSDPEDTKNDVKLVYAIGRVPEGYELRIGTKPTKRMDHLSISLYMYPNKFLIAMGYEWWEPDPLVHELADDLSEHMAKEIARLAPRAISGYHSDSLPDHRRVRPPDEEETQLSEDSLQPSEEVEKPVIDVTPVDKAEDDEDDGLWDPEEDGGVWYPEEEAEKAPEEDPAVQEEQEPEADEKPKAEEKPEEPDPHPVTKAPRGLAYVKGKSENLVTAGLNGLVLMARGVLSPIGGINKQHRIEPSVSERTNPTIDERDGSTIVTFHYRSRVKMTANATIALQEHRDAALKELRRQANLYSKLISQVLGMQVDASEPQSDVRHGVVSTIEVRVSSEPTNEFDASWRVDLTAAINRTKNAALIADLVIVAIVKGDERPDGDAVQAIDDEAFRQFTKAEKQAIGVLEKMRTDSDGEKNDKAKKPQHKTPEQPRPSTP